MQTPIRDFVLRYESLRPARFHMPGHKGRGPLGCEEWDITEIPGADSLCEAAGIIAGSEANASKLFGCPTFYSTEGSSHCIRAMLLLAMQYTCRDKHCLSARSDEATWDGEKRIATASVRTGLAMTDTKRFRVLAARNVHRAFLTAAALLDLDVCWLPNVDGSYLSASVTPEALDAALAETGASAVYLTCPDYLGFLPDLRPLAAVCHSRGALLLVDNAHGAYLRFLSPSRHPMDLGADLCCDSAHKTLPVLTGGAYLHVSEALSTGEGALHPQAVRDALALFGSTSPSYLILQSLDLANPYLETLSEELAAFLPRVETLKTRLRAAGWRLMGDEPLKLTLCCHSEPCPEQGRRGSEESVLPAAQKDGGTDPSTPLRSAQDDRPGNGLALAAALEREGILCEFADPDFAVFMLSPQNTQEELDRLEQALIREIRPRQSGASRQIKPLVPCHLSPVASPVCSIREAMLAPAETVPAAKSLGRVLATPGVSCPPAVPILMPGERISAADLVAFERYGIEAVSVLSLK